MVALGGEIDIRAALRVESKGTLRKGERFQRVDIKRFVREAVNIFAYI